MTRASAPSLGRRMADSVDTQSTRRYTSGFEAVRSAVKRRAVALAQPTLSAATVPPSLCDPETSALVQQSQIHLPPAQNGRHPAGETRGRRPAEAGDPVCIGGLGRELSTKRTFDANSSSSAIGVANSRWKTDGFVNGWREVILPCYLRPAGMVCRSSHSRLKRPPPRE